MGLGESAGEGLSDGKWQQSRFRILCFLKVEMKTGGFVISLSPVTKAVGILCAVLAKSSSRITSLIRDSILKARLSNTLE